MDTTFIPFELERWQSAWENQVAYNLAESGVHPLTIAELLEMAEGDRGLEALSAVRLGYGWANGAPPLREAIATLYDGVELDALAVTNGSAEANFVALWELVEPGSEVVVLLPTYMQSPGLVRMLGGRVREVWLREELGWQPDPDEIRAAFGATTKAVVVTNPVNPTGSVLSPEARSAIVESCERTGAWILADEVYAGAELDGPRTPSFFGATERVIATGSLSKAYGLPGLRFGWALAGQQMAERLWARTDYTTIGHGPLTEYLATTALEPSARERILRRTREHLTSNLPLVDELAAAGLIRYRPPDAGAIAWVRYLAEIPSGQLADRLRRERDVLVVPGEHFGMEGFLRLGYGADTDTVRHGLAGLADFLRDLTS